MLSYKHHYHAGNFADVHKHLAQIAVLDALFRKDSACLILDTHAGSGHYDLLALPEKHSTEYRNGIARLWDLDPRPTQLTRYLNLIQSMNPGSQLRYYPGSPAIAQQLLRSQDRLQLLELHPAEYQTLKKFMRSDHRVSVHKRDAYEGLIALLPPKEKRGVVLIDPSYEIKTEPEQLLEAVKKAWQRWRNGVYLIWYPLLPSGLHIRLLEGLTAGPFTQLWHCEIKVKKPLGEHGLYGSGLVLINPPWRVPEQLSEQLPALASWLSQGVHTVRHQWLRGPQ